MAQIPASTPQSEAPLSQKELDKKVTKLISLETKKKVSAAEALIAKAKTERDSLALIKDDIEKANGELDSLTEQKGALQGEITLSLDKIVKLKDSLAALSKEEDDKKSSLGIVSDELKKIDAELLSASTRIDGLNSRIAEAQDTITAKERKAEELDRVMLLKREDIESLNQRYSESIRVYDDRLKDMKDNLDKFETETEAVKRKCATFNGEIKELTSDRDELMKEIDLLKEERFKLSIETEDYKAVIDSEYKKKYDQLEEQKKVVTEKEFNTKLLSDGLADRKAHLEAYRQKLLKIVGSLMVDETLSDKTKAALRDINSKL